MTLGSNYPKAKVKKRKNETRAMRDVLPIFELLLCNVHNKTSHLNPKNNKGNNHFLISERQQ